MVDHSERSRQLLAAHMKKTRTLLDNFLDSHGTNITVLGKAMENYTSSVFDLPEESACKSGCAWCCHLQVGVSIPELLVIYAELLTQTTQSGLDYFKKRIVKTVNLGNTLDEDFWYKNHPPCPFLNEQNSCLIYHIRPFSCRAHHSTDMDACKKGFDEKRQVQVPCFPLYRATTDMYSSVFIKVLSDRGFASFQIEFVKGLAMLFENQDQGLEEAWMKKKDVFTPAKL